ncbi:hypothetical protein F5887DRAFT_919545 [Amanita rubescens]|nr:hypothetical protein F5887DRAFT_919545 [Amanita rubescens]
MKGKGKAPQQEDESDSDRYYEDALSDDILNSIDLTQSLDTLTICNSESLPVPQSSNPQLIASSQTPAASTSAIQARVMSTSRECHGRSLCCASPRASVPSSPMPRYYQEHTSSNAIRHSPNVTPSAQASTSTTTRTHSRPTTGSRLPTLQSDGKKCWQVKNNYLLQQNIDRSVPRGATCIHVSGFAHCNHKSYGTYGAAAKAWVGAVRENTVGFSFVELYWAVTVGVQTGVYRDRTEAIMVSGGRRDVMAYLTAFDDIHAAHAYFVQEHMAGRIVTLVASS